jgi:hypothetical protein
MALVTLTNRAKRSSPMSAGTDLRMAVLVGSGVAGLTADDVEGLTVLSELDAIPDVDLHTDRQPLTGGIVTEDDAGDRAAFGSDRVFFAPAPGVTAAGVAVYKEGPTDAARMLISVHRPPFPLPLAGGLAVGIPPGIDRGA